MEFNFTLSVSKRNGMKEKAGFELRLACLFKALLLSCSLASAAETLQVVDGDTMDVAGVRYRLHGIDAAEAGQKCPNDRGGNWPCGQAAIAALEELVKDRQVHCDDRGSDDYGRTIAVCFANGRDINHEMVASGLAWAFRKYSEDYVDTEDQARQLKTGIWQAPTQPAWEYRSEKWAVAQQTAPSGCPIKGNISKGGKIYHAPWSPWYAKTKVSVAQGEQWFCNEAEAVKAGWRAPYWGRGSTGLTK
ncbi:thermonuclease family protein [Sinorhizobium medicae]